MHGGELTAPFSGDGKVMLHSEHQMNRTVARCLSKIAFNYMALTCGATFVLAKGFDGMREFIRYDIGDARNRVFLKQKAIIAQEIISGTRGADGHVLTVEGRLTDRMVEVQVALFNSIPYRIPMGEYVGDRFAKGHYFCVHSWGGLRDDYYLRRSRFRPGRIHAITERLNPRSKNRVVDELPILVAVLLQQGSDIGKSLFRSFRRSRGIR